MRSFAYSTRYAIDTVRAITRRGSTLRLTRGQPGRARRSKAAPGVARSVLDSLPDPARFRPRSIDVPLRLPKLTSICSSKNMASTSSSSWDSSHTCVWRPRCALPLGYDVTVIRRRPRIIPNEPQMPLSTVNLASYAGAIVAANEVVESR